MHEFFKVLADETRLRCLAIIFNYGEVCVCELIHALELPQSKISRHLAILKLNKIIRQRREGQWIFYAIHPELSPFKQRIIQQTIKELGHTSPFKEDTQHLATMDCRPSLSNKAKAEKAHV